MPEYEVRRAISYRKTTIYELLLLSKLLNDKNPERLNAYLLDPTPPIPKSLLPPVKWEEFVPRPFKLKPPPKDDIEDSPRDLSDNTT